MTGAPLSELPRSLLRTAPRVASGVAVELGWTAAHLLMYPLGIRPTRFEQLATARSRRAERRAARAVPRQLDAAGTPILLVHGIVDNHSIFTVMEQALRRRGFRTLSAYDYGLLTRDIAEAAELLGEEIEKLAANTGYERVHVIGHSLGGLIARYYVQRLGGDAQVHTLVTLGTPHQGTQLAYAARLLPLVRQLTPDSPVIRALAEPAPGCRTRFVAFHSDLDHLVGPSGNAMIVHPDLNAPTSRSAESATCRCRTTGTSPSRSPRLCEILTQTVLLPGPATSKL